MQQRQQQPFAFLNLSALKAKILRLRLGLQPLG